MSAEQILPIFFTFMGLVMVVYVFAFTIYDSFLNELYGLNKEIIKKKIDVDVDEKVRNRIEKSFYYGGTLMQLALVWCLFSALIGILGIKLLLLTANGLNAVFWIWLIRLTSCSLGILILSILLRYVLKTKKHDQKCTYSLCIYIIAAITSAIPYWVSLRFNCVNYLKTCLLWLMFGMVIFLMLWLYSTIITTPLISLQELRKKLRKKLLSHLNQSYHYE